MFASPSRMSRRALVVGGVVLGTAGAGALSGCEVVDDALGRNDEPVTSGEVATTAPPADADGTLVSEVLTALSTAGALATATGTAIPGLAKAAGRLARLHAAHAAELGGAIDAPAPTVGGPRPAARAALLDAEAALQDSLVSAAQRAESGALAQMFASMAAAVAQQRIVLS